MFDEIKVIQSSEVSVTKDAGDDYPFLVVPAHDPSPDVEDTCWRS